MLSSAFDGAQVIEAFLFLSIEIKRAVHPWLKTSMFCALLQNY